MIRHLGRARLSGIGDNFQGPEIRLDHVVVRGVGLTGGNLDLIVRSRTQQLHPAGTKLQVGVDVGARTWATSPTTTTSGSENGETTSPCRLRFGWSGVGSAVRAALGYGDLPYKMKGQATLKIAGGQHVVPFTHEGRAPLTRSGGNVAAPRRTIIHRKVTLSDH